MKVLFICPNYYGIYKIIEKGIQDNYNVKITTIISNAYKYKNVGQKILNFISKILFKRNLKKEWSSKECVSNIKSTDYFDYIFIICPDFLLNEELKYLKSKTKKFIVYYWDSFDNIPRYERTLPYFDKHFSFEKKDVIKYNLNFLTNFYYQTNFDLVPNFDVYFIGALDERISILLKIINIMPDKQNKIIIQSNKKSKLNKLKGKGFDLIKKPISFMENQNYFKDSKIIIDIQKTIQDGLTFRVFEAMSHKKKLITTNTDIVNYDFYNPNNIFIWEESVDKIPNDFFESPYQDIPIEIYNKYSLKSFLNTIFE